MTNFFEKKPYDFDIDDSEDWVLVHSGAITNTNPGSMVYVSINTTPICSNMSNREFRKLIMKARDAAISLILQRIEGVTAWDKAEQARARLYFGRSDNDVRSVLAAGLPRLLNAMRELAPEKIVRWDDSMNRRLTCGVVPDSGNNIAGYASRTPRSGSSPSIQNSAQFQTEIYGRYQRLKHLSMNARTMSTHSTPTTSYIPTQNPG